MSPTQKNTEDWSAVYSLLKREWDKVVTAKKVWVECGILLADAAEEENLWLLNDLTAQVASARIVWQDQERIFFDQISAEQTELGQPGELASHMLLQQGGLEPEEIDDKADCSPSVPRHLAHTFAISDDMAVNGGDWEGVIRLGEQ